MRHLAVGDIHGCFKALTTLAAFVPFKSEDVVITLGDYVDRGPDSCKVLDWLIWYAKRGQLVPLLGNHEDMMLKARESPEALIKWKECGGTEALHSYSSSAAAGSLQNVPDAHWEFLEKRTRRYFETDKHFFVHANALPDHPLEDQPDIMLLWGVFGTRPAHQSGKVMICGHTSQKSGEPKDIGHAVCIDTWAHGGGWLTCLDAVQGKYWQANQKGESRTDWL
jgi:serine/threonine protein phosphatase 1